jgi:hypothetical protein
VGDIHTLASDIAANPGGAYALANSYDASKDGTYTQSPIPTTFAGTFEGLRNIISNLTILVLNGQDYATGLFSEVSQSGSVDDLVLQNVSVTVDHNTAGIGALAGSNQGMVGDDTVSGSLSGERDLYTGGLIGVNSGTIAYCASGVTVKANTSLRVSYQSVGGLVGISVQGTITQSFATGPVSGADNVGGLVGVVDSGTVSNSFATGDVKSVKRVGSIVGGLVGAFTGSSISSSYSTGMVKGGPERSYIGGFIGDNSAGQGAIANAYWDTKTSGTDLGVGSGSESGVTGVTTRQLQAGLPAGFDPTVWAENPLINNGLPYLIANPPPQ